MSLYKEFIVLLVVSASVSGELIKDESCHSKMQMFDKMGKLEKQIAMLSDTMKNVAWSVMEMEMTFNRFKREMEAMAAEDGSGAQNSTTGTESNCTKNDLENILAQYIKDRMVVEVKIGDGSSISCEQNTTEIDKGDVQTSKPIKSCKEANETGPFKLKLDGVDGEFQVLCNNGYEGGGWLTVQRRFNGSVDFYRDWANYRDGFGDVSGEFWIGNELLYQITKTAPRELHFFMSDWDDKTTVAKYSTFQIGSESESFVLKSLGSFSGAAGDSLSRNVNSKFSTKDRDNDSYEQSCAQLYFGGWWYDRCHLANLNGKYLRGTVSEYATMMCWSTFKGFYYGLKTSEILIRF